MYKGRRMQRVRRLCVQCMEYRIYSSFPADGPVCVYCQRGANPKSKAGIAPITREERLKAILDRIKRRAAAEARLLTLARKYPTVWDMKQAMKKKGIMHDESKRPASDRTGSSGSVRRDKNPRFPANYVSGYRSRSGLGNPRIAKD